MFYLKTQTHYRRLIGYKRHLYQTWDYSLDFGFKNLILLYGEAWWRYNLIPGKMANPNLPKSI